MISDYKFQCRTEAGQCATGCVFGYSATAAKLYRIIQNTSKGVVYTDGKKTYQTKRSTTVFLFARKR